MSSTKTKLGRTLALLGAAALGVALLRQASQRKQSKKTKSKELAKDPKEQVLETLRQMAQAQKVASKHIQELRFEVLTKRLNLEETCRRIVRLKLQDPIEACGMSPQAFSDLLSQHQADRAVHEALAVVMSSQISGTPASDAAQALPVAKLTEIYSFMAKEFQELDEQDQALQAKKRSKELAFATQAIVGARVIQAFGLEPEDIEKVVILRQSVLMTDPKFLTANAALQRISFGR